VHEQFINRLAAAGVVLGLPDGSYGANQTVSRGQMATFLARAYKQVTGRTCRRRATSSTTTRSRCTR
jgi:hypothetical protein